MSANLPLIQAIERVLADCRTSAKSDTDQLLAWAGRQIDSLKGEEYVRLNREHFVIETQLRMQRVAKRQK